MGDKNRSNLMAECISKNFNKIKTVLIVADGDGTLSSKLAEKGYNAIAIEAKPRQSSSRKNVDYRKGWFSANYRVNADLIVGMHPDEATSEIIRWAIKNRKPFAVCPCCIIGFGSKSVSSFKGWLNYLKSLARRADYNVFECSLRMTGKNIVLIGKL
jgi:hypothetical protein